MIIIIRTMNLTPEYQIRERLKELEEQGVKFKIVSATTSICTHGNMEWKGVTVAEHVYFVTTVVLDILAPQNLVGKDE